MRKTTEVTRQNKLPNLIAVAAVVFVAAFWVLNPKSGGLNLLDVFSSALVVGTSIVLSFSVSRYVETRKKVLLLRIEEKKLLAMTNEVGCCSDVGKVRKIDEDSVFSAKLYSSNNGVVNQKILMIVADGMGGHSKGEVASALGVSTVVNRLLPELTVNKEEDYGSALSSAVMEANGKILNYAMDHPECEGMGTTLTASLIDQEKICVAHVGDARAYRISNSEITRLTKDHSLVQELVDKGEITEEQASMHPQKNVITRVVGVYPTLNVDIYEYPWTNSDQILLCCDGLVNHVKDNEITEITQSASNPKDTCKQLIKVANDRGGKDNISAILTPQLGQVLRSTIQPMQKAEGGDARKVSRNLARQGIGRQDTKM
jgi:PPM family protein phosphatase